MAPPLLLLRYERRSLPESPHPCKPNQTKAEKQHGGRFGHRINVLIYFDQNAPQAVRLVEAELKWIAPADIEPGRKSRFSQDCGPHTEAEGQDYACVKGAAHERFYGL